MNKTLTKGFFLGIVFLALLVAAGLFISSQDSEVIYNGGVSSEEWKKWETLSISERIEKTNALVVLRFKKENETMAAYADKVILRGSSTSPPLKVGDRVENSDFYVTEHSNPNQRNGVLLLYVGNPLLKMEGTFLYSNDLIAYNDMRIEIFLKKFKESIK